MAKGGGFKYFWPALRHAIVRIPRATRANIEKVRQAHADGMISWKGVVYLWKAAHRDQRMSWFGHYLVSVGLFSTGLGLIFAALGHEFAVGWRHGSSVSWTFFMVREMIDEWYHREVLEDYDKVDQDQNIEGQPRLMVTPRGDKVADLAGPTFHWISTWAAHWVGA